MKKDLISTQNQELTLDSREVAQMMEVDHWEILRKLEGSKDRKGYIKILTDNQMVASDYFIKSSYVDESGKENKCYLLTKMGCEFLANKFTGEKGILFTAKYVQKFNQMESAIKAPMQELSPQLQLLINMELKQREFEIAITETKSEIQGMRDVIKLDTNSWRTDSKDLIVKISHRLGGNEFIREIRNESYELLNTRMGVSLETRLTNKRRRMADEGVSKSKRDKLNLLDVIADDKKLIEGYIAIVKEMSIKYGI